jgi:hypothetical protein
MAIRRNAFSCRSGIIWEKSKRGEPTRSTLHSGRSATSMQNSAPLPSKGNNAHHRARIGGASVGDLVISGTIPRAGKPGGFFLSSCRPQGEHPGAQLRPARLSRHRHPDLTLWRVRSRCRSYHYLRVRVSMFPRYERGGRDDSNYIGADAKEIVLQRHMTWKKIGTKRVPITTERRDYLRPIPY